MQHTTTTLCYVRTTDGVVKVGAGERVPQDALPDALDRLLAAGAIAQSPERVEPTSVAEILEHVGNDVERARAALDLELARRSPRTKLVAGLEKVLVSHDASGDPEGDDDPDAPASGESED